MKKTLGIILILAVLILPVTFLTGCNRSDLYILRVGATTSPHAIVLEQVQDELREAGFDLRITVLSDFTTGNPALARGDLIANYFQHRPFLENFNANTNNNLQPLAGIHFEPLGIFPGQRASIAALQPGDRIIIPNDVTNYARAHTLLAANGIDVSQFQIYPVLASNLTTLRTDAALAVINGNWALGAGIIDLRLTYETPELGERYTNIIAIRDGYQNHAGLNALVTALQSDRIRDFILNRWNGAIVPNFIGGGF
ncbi:MAG: MetQ/NlpA family ABC transporter substrate-binding protein [Firmicutes bacterium]|nr:MetQ/NlpA family ABC transporter substrate-binding protein [Bacillota bacterium]